MVQRIAYVTGGMGGIGTSICQRLAKEGHVVIAGCGPSRDYNKWINEQKEAGFTFHASVGNVADWDSTRDAFAKVREEHGNPDIVVNNAGITRDGLFVRMSDADWDAVLEVNLTAVFRLTRELTHPMMRRRYGRIINISSVVGVTGNPGQANYCASKAGLIGFSKSLAQEIASRNVTVNCIAPGFIESAMTGKLNDKQKETIMAAIPMRRMGTGAEVASAAVYLAAEESAYVTGQTIHVNGGMAMI